MKTSMYGRTPTSWLLPAPKSSNSVCSVVPKLLASEANLVLAFLKIG